MTRYLLSVIQPYGEGPPPANLDEIMRDVDALTGEMRAAGVPFVSPGVVTLPAHDLGFARGALTRDPDGHAMQVVAR